MRPRAAPLVTSQPEAPQLSRPAQVFLMQRDVNQFRPQRETWPEPQARVQVASPVEARTAPHLSQRESTRLQVCRWSERLVPASLPIGSPSERTARMPPPAQ